MFQAKTLNPKFQKGRFFRVPRWCSCFRCLSPLGFRVEALGFPKARFGVQGLGFRV